MKLNVGSGGTRIAGYISIDIRQEVKPDIVGDIRVIAFPENSIEAVYCSHTIEHLCYEDAKSVLKKFYVWLEPNGVLYLAVPNYDVICRLFSEHPKDTYLKGLMFGNNRYETDVHRFMWSQNFLIETMRKIGFLDGGGFEPFVNNAENTGFDASGVWYRKPDGGSISLSLNRKFIARKEGAS